MFEFMSLHEASVLTNSNNEGIERVKEAKGGYAFFMESSSIEYIMERECALTKVGWSVVRLANSRLAGWR